MSDHETPLEMARRHVAEAEQRLARQEWRIGELESDGLPDVLSDARALLERMRDFLRVCRVHLDYEAAKQEGKRDEVSFRRLLDLLNAMKIVPDPREPNSN